MEYGLLSDITIGSKYLVLGGALSNDALIHTNQAILAIGRQVHSDWDISSGSQNGCN